MTESPGGPDTAHRYGTYQAVLQVQAFSSSELNIGILDNSDGQLVLDWRGKSNDRHPKKLLGPFFATAADAGTQRSAGIHMKFEHLEYLNSSTISALIGFIRQLEDRKVKLLITFDGRLKWQKLCFDALRIFERPGGCFSLREVD